MLRITKSKSASAAKAYFREALQSADYYLEGRDVAGEWRGLGAAYLGLAGPVSQKEFAALVENRTPRGEKLTARDRANRIPGIDFTANAPKSVSLLWAVTRDDRIKEAHKRAVSAMMGEIERNMEARVRKGRAAKTQATRNTGNAVWAEFLHDTARPVDGSPDPHLHTHCYLINATHDGEEDRWKAAEIGNIAGEHKYYEAVYHATLAREMKKLGFNIERRGQWWDVKGLSRKLLEKFSRRAAEVDAAAAAEGATPEQKAALAKRTRTRKTDALAYEDLHSVWKTRLLPQEAREIEAVVRAAEGGSDGRSRGVLEAWRYALGKALERHSVASEKQVMTEALRFGFGDVTPAEIRQAARDPEIIDQTIEGRSFITTREKYERERRLLKLARSGRSASDPLGHGAYEISDARLNSGQRAAIEHVWSSPDCVMLIRGGAGVGKTKGVLAEAVNGLLAAGHRVFGAAPTGTAVDELASDVVADARTVASLIVNVDAWPRMSGGVLVVDEASLIGVDDLVTLMERAEENDIRLILCGDEKQHSAVSAGDAFRLLRQWSGLKTAEVREIVRQKGAYADAVKAIEQGEIEDGWRRFEALGAVIETPGPKRLDDIAADYVGETDAGMRVLAVAPTHAEKDALSGKIRAGLKSLGALSAAERPVMRLIDMRWTDAERGDGERYRAGMFVKFFQNAAGIAKGERSEIIAVRDGQPILANGRILPLDQADRFKVYRAGELALAPGDLVRISENGRTEEGREVRTGAVVRVEGFNADGDIELENGSTLSQTFGHLDHGYVATSHASQGRTVDVVLASLGSQSLPAISLEQFYVTVSRGKKAARIYTDDRKAVAEATARTSHRGSAIELVEGRVDKERRPTKRRDRLAGFYSTMDRAMRSGLERAEGEISEVDLMRQARSLAAAEYKGRLNDKGAELGD